MEMEEPPPCPVSTTATVAIPHYNPEIELSTDTDDSASDLAGEAGQEEVAAVLEALSGERGTSESVRSQVMSLVQRLAERCCRLERLNEELQRAREEQEQRIASLERQFQPVIKHESVDFHEKLESPDSPCLPAEEQDLCNRTEGGLKRLLEPKKEVQECEEEPMEQSELGESLQKEEEEAPRQQVEEHVLCKKEEEDGLPLHQQDLSQLKCPLNRSSVGGSPVSVITSPQPSQAAASLSVSPPTTIIVLNTEPVVVE